MDSRLKESSPIAFQLDEYIQNALALLSDVLFDSQLESDKRNAWTLDRLEHWPLERMWGAG